MSALNIPAIDPAGPDRPAKGLRLALMAGFGGMALIFLLATVDAVRLLSAMRAENQALRNAAIQRTNHLTVDSLLGLAYPHVPGRLSA